jgi:uncharacterized membrane protein YdbT with pleckstrin-like domain
MGTVASQLVPGEAVVYKTRRSEWSQWGKIALAGTLVAMSRNYPILLVFAGLLSAYVWLRLATSELAVTNKRVLATNGIISNTTVEIKLPRVEGVVLQQSILGRLFRYGSITVAGAGNVMIPVQMVDKPTKFKKACMAATEGDFGALNTAKEDDTDEEEAPVQSKKVKKKAKATEPVEVEQRNEPKPQAESKKHRFVPPV